MSETKAAFAEHTIRSLETILYRYMEEYGYKYIHKLTQFATTQNSRRNWSIDLIPENVKNSDFLSILYSKHLRELRKPKFELETEFASPSMIYVSRRGISHSLHESFVELLRLLPENLQHKQ